jgi:hypothetical protein
MAMKQIGNALHFTPEEAHDVSLKISDVNCFLDGMEFARGEGLPWQFAQGREFLRDLNIKLKKMEWRQPEDREGETAPATPDPMSARLTSELQQLRAAIKAGDTYEELLIRVHDMLDALKAKEA